MSFHVPSAKVYELLRNRPSLEDETQTIRRNEEALKTCNKESNPEQWITLHIAIALAHQTFALVRSNSTPLQQRQIEMDKAIVHAQNALDCLALAEDGYKYAVTINLLAEMHSDYPCNDDATRFKMDSAAIQLHIDGIAALEKDITNDQAKARWQAFASPNASSIHFALAKLYKRRHDVGDLDLAIRHALKSLEYCPPEAPIEVQQMYTAPVDVHRMVAMWCTPKATNMFEICDRVDLQEEAIKQHRQVVKLASPTDPTLSYTWASSQLHLGTLYSCREIDEHRLNLELALVSLRKSLKVFGAHLDSNSADNQIDEWIESHLLLGDVYRWREAGNRDANIEASIEHYETAVASVSEMTDPDLIVQLLRGQAQAYRSRTKGKRFDNISNARRLLLDCENHDSMTIEFTHAELVMVHMERSLVPRDDDDAETEDDNNEIDIQNAVLCATIHLAEVNEHKCLAFVAEAHGLLAMAGHVHCCLVSAEGGMDEVWVHYEEAIRLYDEHAKESYVCAEAECQHTMHWQTRKEQALIQNKIYLDYASAMFEFGFPGEHSVQVEIAIDILQRALLFFDKDMYPKAFAGSHTLLAMTWLQRVEGNLRENIENSHRSYEKCVSVLGVVDYLPPSWEQDNMKIGAVHRREALVAKEKTNSLANEANV